jgi:hypothetical protein
MASKVSRSLAGQMVELQTGSAAAEGSRAQRIARLKDAFEHEADAVRRTIEELGGEVLESAWINSTLRTRLPKRALQQLEEDDRVASLDSTRPLEVETSSTALPSRRPGRPARRP